MKLENRRGEQVLPGRGFGTCGRGVNIVQIMHTHAKMTPVETVPGIGGGEMKVYSGGEF
jgi:hypothetical protein